MASKPRSRHVLRKPDGWAVKAPRASRASSIHRTQQEAIDAAKQIVANQGGGEVRVHGVDGRIREGITVKPGNDPYPPPG
ncbi:MAG: DUF2188 domain-containing protein [Chloroflexi bacterium]|nr:DUF2188 domain-containing protein [Chloroflexota bacterium]